MLGYIIDGSRLSLFFLESKISFLIRNTVLIVVYKTNFMRLSFVLQSVQYAVSFPLMTLQYSFLSSVHPWRFQGKSNLFRSCAITDEEDLLLYFPYYY